MSNKSSSIVTESDVEQKVIYNLLINKSPGGMGFNDSDILTKPHIKRIVVDKGQKQKSYYPDYAVVVNGLPGLIIEAKLPGGDLEEAAREARLYATEVNASYKTNINPCSRIVVSDGNVFNVYDWDDVKVKHTIEIDNINVLSPEYDKFINYISKNEIHRITNECLKLISKKSSYYKPIYMLGGKSVITETVGQNSFGSNVSLEYRYLFNPEEMSERNNIALNAYVASKRKESHISPIDKVIKAAIPRSEVDARQLDDTINPEALIGAISQKKINGVRSFDATFGLWSQV